MSRPSCPSTVSVAIASWVPEPVKALLLARHSDIRLTMGIYTHIEQEEGGDGDSEIAEFGVGLAF